MKTFKQVMEDYDIEANKQQHERIIDSEISELCDIDSHMRETMADKAPRTTPLLYNMSALIALKTYYFGKRHSDIYPQHAKNTGASMEILKKEIPHLIHIIKPEQSGYEHR
jgi:hypothetical protein